MSQRWIAALLALVSWTAAHAAETYPDRPIRMVVALPPGTATDFLARTLAQPLSEHYKQQVVVDNRPGAGGLIGSNIVAKAVPDGYTITMIAPGHIVGALMQAKPPYHPLNDFTAVSEVAAIPNVLIVSPGTQAKNVQELIKLARSKPGEFNFASVGVGTIAHVSAEIFNRAAGIKAVHVPFKIVGDVYAEALADRIHYFLFVVPTALPMLKDGRLRAIAVSSARRAPTLPDLPTFAESGLPGAQTEGWFALLAPRGTPRRIVALLAGDTAKALAEPRVKEAFARQSAEPAIDPSPEKLVALMRSEYDRFSKLVNETGLRQP